MNRYILSHSLWGVWVEILVLYSSSRETGGHSLWGVWVEISARIYLLCWVKNVTPFGECGLKCQKGLKHTMEIIVTPFGECGLKYGRLQRNQYRFGHSLWGVWVEISSDFLG